MSVWERFDDIASVDEVVDAKNKFTPIEAGEYEVALEELKPDENKDGLPMLKGKFRILDSNRFVFYNQNLQNLNYPDMTASMIADAVNFVGNLMDEEIEYKGLTDLAQKVESITLGEVYKIKVFYGTKDLEMKFPKIKVLEKLKDITPVAGEGEVPF